MQLTTRQDKLVLMVRSNAKRGDIQMTWRWQVCVVALQILLSDHVGSPPSALF